ncbi:MAG: amino acid adenylation domain-containing protein [Casimicrobiaceae bacterium]
MTTATDCGATPEPALSPARETQAAGGIVARFERVAQRCPSAAAYRCAGQALAYAELDRRSRLVARRLAAQGIARGDVVAVAFERDPLYAVAMLGVLRAGAACMPLDVGGPRVRNAAMLHASGARALLANGDPGFRVADGIVRMDAADVEQHARAALDAPDEHPFGPQRLAFVIHTSGSSGQPKGVEISEGQVLHRIDWDWSARPRTATDVACQQAPLGFVDSIAEWLGPLLQGVTTEILTDAVLAHPRKTVAALSAASVSRIQLVPSRLALLLDVAPDLAHVLPHLRLWTTSGEPLSGALVERFRRAAPLAQLWNVYGATEALGATGLQVREAEAIVPIGRALPGMRAHVLDDAMQPLPVGTIGDLYVAGNGLARGYRADPALTRERFVSIDGGERMYRTGDRARMRADGVLECLGRADRRINVNGVRVELGEMEAVLASYPGVREVVVLHDDARIVAHVAPRDGIDTAQMRVHARARLLAGALPHAIVTHAALPRNAHGKVDRALLSMPVRANDEPRDDLERTLVAMYGDVLGRGSIGATDDFFEQGGDSLLAVRLVAAIEAATGIAFPLNALAATRTPRAIAVGLGQHWSQWTSTRIVLNPDGAQPPLFAVAGASGYALRMLSIGRHLGPDTAFHALQPPQMQWPPQASVTTMAAHYVEEILGVCPAGPYRLLGSSFGGMIVFEIALQLQSRGHAPPLLCMVDSAAPGTPCTSRTPDPVPDRALTPAEATGRRIDLVHTAAANAYVPGGIHAGRAVYFRCAQTRATTLRQWQRLITSPIEVVPVPGAHGEYHRQPQRAVIVSHLREVLRNFEPRALQPRLRSAGLCVPSIKRSRSDA